MPISRTPEVPQLPLNFVHSFDPLSNFTTSVVTTVFEIVFAHWNVAFALALAFDARMILIPSNAPRHAAVNPLKLKLPIL